MRTTPSRFNGYIASIDPNFEGGPARSQPANSVSATSIQDPHQAPAQVTELSILERRHPAVIETLRLLWGYPELNQYFDKVNSGCDSSLNFAPDAMAELMVLAALHQRICPHRPATPVTELYGSGRGADTWKLARPRR